MPKHQLFICVSNEETDRAFVKALLLDLERLDLQALMDRAEAPRNSTGKPFPLGGRLKLPDVDADAEWTPQIAKAISACAAVVVLLSEAAMKSSLVMAEIGQGLSLNKPIITILGSGANVRFHVPDFLKRKPILDSRQMSSLVVAAAIGSVVKRTSQQSELTKLLREQKMARIAMFALAAVLVLSTTLLVLVSWLKPNLSRLFH